jgi:hypothetical protein
MSENTEQIMAQQDARTRRMQMRIINALSAVGLVAFVAVGGEIAFGLHKVANSYPVRLDNCGPRPNVPQSQLN